MSSKMRLAAKIAAATALDVVIFCTLAWSLAGSKR
jgi:hypothetical protein